MSILKIKNPDGTWTGVPTVQGDKGDPGLTPDIQIGKVETLNPGEQATASITGTPEKPELNLGIPQGKDGSGGSTIDDTGEPSSTSTRSSKWLNENLPKPGLTEVPLATKDIVGGFKANPSVQEDTQEVHITPEGFLKTKKELPDHTVEDKGKFISVTEDGSLGFDSGSLIVTVAEIETEPDVLTYTADHTYNDIQQAIANKKSCFVKFLPYNPDSTSTRQIFMALQEFCYTEDDRGKEETISFLEFGMYGVGRSRMIEFDKNNNIKLDTIYRLPPTKNTRKVLMDKGNWWPEKLWPGDIFINEIIETTAEQDEKTISIQPWSKSAMFERYVLGYENEIICLTFTAGQTANAPYIAFRGSKYLLLNSDETPYKCQPKQFDYFIMAKNPENQMSLYNLDIRHKLDPKIPNPTVNDANKTIKVNQEGKYELATSDNSLGITAAQVGQIIKVKEIGPDGNPTKWEAADLPSGGGGADKPVLLRKTVNLDGQSVKSLFFNFEKVPKHIRIDFRDTKTNEKKETDIKVALQGYVIYGPKRGKQSTFTVTQGAGKLTSGWEENHRFCVYVCDIGPVATYKYAFSNSNETLIEEDYTQLTPEISPCYPDMTKEFQITIYNFSNFTGGKILLYTDEPLKE